MLRRLIVVCAVFGLLAIALSGFAQQSDKPKPRTLKIKVNYTGAGTVDEKHPIWVFVWDKPDFATNPTAPVFAPTAKTKDATLTIDDLGVSPVYVVAVYDQTGNYSGMEPPPSGSSVTAYGGGPTPAPVKVDPGQTVTIDLPFDDSVKVP